MTTTKKKTPEPRYEFRVWGRRRKLIDRLASLADIDRSRELTDCYLLTPDPSLNVKIRHRRLKIKRLVEERAGLQQWSSSWHRHPGEAPKPFDDLLTELAKRSADARNTAKLAKHINATDLGLQAVAVTKNRRRLRLGTVRAEVAELAVGDRAKRLTTVAIVGRDIDDLLHLRDELGLSKTPNVAVHLAIDLDAAL